MPVLVSDYQSYLDGGGTDDYLTEYCKQYEKRLKSNQYMNRRSMSIGSRFGITLPSPPDQKPFRIPVLKLAESEYRFGHTYEELEAVRVLHGLPGDPPW